MTDSIGLGSRIVDLIFCSLVIGKNANFKYRNREIYLFKISVHETAAYIIETL